MPSRLDVMSFQKSISENDIDPEPDVQNPSKQNSDQKLNFVWWRYGY